MDRGDAAHYLTLFAIGGFAGVAIAADISLWVWAAAVAVFVFGYVLLTLAPSDAGARTYLVIAFAGALMVAGPGIVVAATLNGAVPVQDGVPLSSTDNTTVVLEGSTNALLDDFTILSGTVDLKTDAGNMTVFSTGNTEVHVKPGNITGTWTNVTEIAAKNDMQFDPEDKQKITVGKDIDHIAWRDNTRADDGIVDFVYGNTSGSGQSSVTLGNVSANTNLKAVDKDTNNILSVATSNGAGQVTFSNLTNSKHAVLLKSGGTEPPTLSNPRPTGPQTSQPNTFKVDVNDTEFSQGDSVTAELYVGQNSKGTDTLTSNGTASVSHTPDLGKSIDYSWVATDSFGNTAIINETLTTPVNVTFREEHNASQIITGVNATLTLFSTDAKTIIERSDNNDDGNITLEGLPDKEFVAVAESDDHYTRRVYIESIFSQQNIFLLNKTEVPGGQAINTTFVFEDRTGNFPAENTTLRIQRGLDINNDNESEWLTVAGDFWGAAAEFPFTGEENARYRLVVENRDGERRVLGTHIPTSDGVKTVINGQIRWNADNPESVFFDAVLNQSSQTIESIYVDPDNDTSDVRIQVWERGNRSNEIYDQNFTSGPYGTIANNPLASLTSDQSDKTWVVRWTYTHNGNQQTGQVVVGAPQVNLPVDPWLLVAFAVLGVTFVGTLYGPRTATIGAWMMVIAVLGLTAFGLAQFPLASIVAGVIVAAGGTLYSEGVP